jgi:hypothetical protein
VPVGVPGEIYVAGAHVARGYLNRPSLTAERFLPDPFGPPGSRMHRTGDVGRFEPSGDLAHLGRTEDQLTIGGLRVQPADVAAALVGHLWVADAIVTASTEARPQLVAYVVPTDAGVTDGELRAHLSNRLPSYLMPAAFVRLAALPMSADGKIDRRALPPVPAATRRAGRRPGSTEMAVQRLFARVLGRHRVGVDDNFFDLGGHSLLAVRLTTLIGQELAVRVPVAGLVARPTVAGLAAYVDATAAAHRGDVTPRIVRFGEAVAA